MCMGGGVIIATKMNMNFRNLRTAGRRWAKGQFPHEILAFPNEGEVSVGVRRKMEN